MEGGERLPGYVRGEYIGTIGCAASPMLYGQQLNHLKVARQDYEG